MGPDRTPSADHERQNSLLTTNQRKRIDANISNTEENRQTRERIRKRVRSGLADFRLLAEHLQPRDRDRIFSAEPFSQEYNALDTDVARAIEFLYVGLDGQARFRRPFSTGVARGEAELGNVEYPGQAFPRFVVHSGTLSHNEREALKLIRAGQWHDVEPPDLFTFVRTAHQADAIDYGAVEESIERFEQLDTREDLLNIDETVEFGKEVGAVLALLQKHDVSTDELRDYLERRESAIEDVNRFIEEYEEYEEEFGEYLEHREEFQEWREEQSD